MARRVPILEVLKHEAKSISLLSTYVSIFICVSIIYHLLLMIYLSVLV